MTKKGLATLLPLLILVMLYCQGGCTFIFDDNDDDDDDDSTEIVGTWSAALNGTNGDRDPAEGPALVVFYADGTWGGYGREEVAAGFL